jgi:hypothetical protein
LPNRERTESRRHTIYGRERRLEHQVEVVGISTRSKLNFRITCSPHIRPKAFTIENGRRHVAVPSGRSENRDESMLWGCKSNWKRPGHRAPGLLRPNYGHRSIFFRMAGHRVHGHNHAAFGGEFRQHTNRDQNGDGLMRHPPPQAIAAGTLP